MGVGIIASSVVESAITDVLMEPFNNYTDAPWTLNGSPPIVAGRTGTAASFTGASTRADYVLGAHENATVTVGFAWRTNTTSTTQRHVLQMFSDDNATQHNRLLYNGTTSQSFTLELGAAVAVLGTTTTGLVPVNTWAYLELQIFLHDTAGTVVFRVNGTERLNLTGLDTRNFGVKTVYDTIRIGPLAAGHTSLYDDLYITVGAGAPFKGDITIGAYDPLTAIPWQTVFWASDPAVTPPADGATITAWNQPGSYTVDEWSNDGTPTFIASWTNGKPAVDYGQGDRLKASFAAAATQNVSVAVVGETTTSESDLCDDANLDGANKRLMIDRVGTAWRLYRGSLISSGAVANATPHLFIARYNGTAGGDYLKVDGTQVIGPTATGTQTNSRIAIGSAATNALHVQSKVAFCGVITRDLTTAEQADLRTWSQSYYGTP
jgi:hypothetical protein